MFDFNKFNKKKSPTWNYNTSDFDYVKTSDVYAKIGDMPFNIHGVFITPDNGYGEGAVLIADKCFVNAPKNFVPTVKEILNDDNAVKEINEHGARVFIEQYYSKKYKRDGYSIVFFEDDDVKSAEINPDDFTDIPSETKTESKPKDVPF